METMITPEFCYLIGVLQSDGSLYKFRVKDRNNRKYMRHMIMLHAKDLSMVKTSKEIFEKSFNRKLSICHKPHKGTFEWKAGVKTLLPKINELKLNFRGPPKPPKWISKIELFGPYLAGVIDGDGYVVIKRPRYPQCHIKITSGLPPILLRKSVIKYLKCGAYIEYKHNYNKCWGKWTTGYDLCFLASPKNSIY